MNMSESCSQSIEHSCHHQILLSGFSSWSGRNGEWNTYWHGDRKSDELGCECALNQSCQGRDTKSIISAKELGTMINMLYIILFI